MTGARAPLPTRWRDVAWAGTALLVCGAALGAPLDAIAPPALALALLIGVPHGAFDGELLEQLAPRARRARLAVYAGAVLAVWLGWSLAPGLATAAFVAVSVWHFGEGDLRGVLGRRPSARGALGRGLAVVGVPLLADWAMTQPVLSAMAATDLLARVPAELAWWVALGLALQHVWAVIAGGAEARELGETLTLLAAMLVAPALLTFAVYFGLWHAPSHLLALARARRAAPSRGTRALELGSAALGLALVALGWWWSSSPTDRATPAALAGALVALAALTVPHALVVELWRLRLGSCARG